MRCNNEVLSLHVVALFFCHHVKAYSYVSGDVLHTHTCSKWSNTHTHKNTLMHCAIALCVCFRLRKSWRERRRCLRKLILTCKRSYLHSGTGVCLCVCETDFLLMDGCSKYVSLTSVLHLPWQDIKPSQASNAVSAVSLSLFSALSSRVGFYVSTFQSLAGFEEKFHKEISRVRLCFNAGFR